MLRILVLGSAAGGGSPQWNCNSGVSKAVRSNAPGTSPRTQSSIVVTANDNEWFLFNASPDLGSQILNNNQMHPKTGLRHSPISGVVLTNGDVDHVAGLLTLRERQNLSVYAQFAALIGKTTDPISGRDTTLGTGLIPLGISTKFGPARFNFEYRIMPSGRFEFGYWNRSYDIERATFSSIDDISLSGLNAGKIITKDSKLGKFGKQKGYFATLDIDIGAYLGAAMSYQNLYGEQWDEINNNFNNDRNQSFLATLNLKKPISRITNARWYYQQRNVPNPFEFNYTENTITKGIGLYLIIIIIMLQSLVIAIILLSLIGVYINMSSPTFFKNEKLFEKALKQDLEHQKVPLQNKEYASSNDVVAENTQMSKRVADFRRQVREENRYGIKKSPEYYLNSTSFTISSSKTFVGFQPRAFNLSPFKAYLTS